MLSTTSEIARRYPTVGPQGNLQMDVNGLACSIELYLGRSALSGSSGDLRPVRWTAFNDRLQRYQGEIEGKAAVVELFLTELRKCSGPVDAKRRFPELTSVLSAIAAVFSSNEGGIDH